eukprot:5764841-Pyramimonas_sp.AAC.5
MGCAITHVFLLGALFGVVDCLICSINSRGEDSKRSWRDVRGSRRRQSEGGLGGGPQSGPRPLGPSPAEIAQVGVGMPEDVSSPFAGGLGRIARHAHAGLCCLRPHTAQFELIRARHINNQTRAANTCGKGKTLQQTFGPPK